MEHIIETKLDNGYTRLTPEAGYILLNIITNKYYSVAVVLDKDKNKFIGVKK